MLPTGAPEQVCAVVKASVEVSDGRDWSVVPALSVNGTNIIVTGRWPRTAHIHDEQWLERKAETPESWIGALRAEQSAALRADIFTFGQILPATSPKYSYRTDMESIAAVRTASFHDWWEKLPQVSRKNVRRSQKRGVEVMVKPLDDNLVADIVELNKDSPVRQGKKFVHYGKTFEQTKKDQMPHLERSDFICAYSGRELVGLLKIVYANGTASILTFLPKTSQYDKRPANALIAKAVEICEQRGVSHLIYGKFRYGKKNQSSLLEFKQRNGFEEFLVPRYYVPLTAWGAFCLRLNLHRGLIGLLPSGVIRAGVSLRSVWGSIATPQGRCSSMLEQPNRLRQMERSIPPAGSNQDQEA